MVVRPRPGHQLVSSTANVSDKLVEPDDRAQPVAARADLDLDRWAVAGDREGRFRGSQPACV